MVQATANATPQVRQLLSLHRVSWLLGMPTAALLWVAGAITAGWVAALLVGLVGATWGLAVAYVSLHGSRHLLCSMLVLWALLLQPLALLIPTVLVFQKGVASTGWLTALAVLPCVALAAATAWHYRQTPRAAPGSRWLDWPGLRVDLQNGRLHPQARAVGSRHGAAAIAGASIPAYAAIQPFVTGQTGLAIVAALVYAGVLAFSATLAARGLAYGLHLQRLERTSGRRFHAAVLLELEPMRQQHGLARVLRRCFPLPQSLSLQAEGLRKPWV